MLTAGLYRSSSEVHTYPFSREFHSLCQAADPAFDFSHLPNQLRQAVAISADKFRTIVVDKFMLIAIHFSKPEHCSLDWSSLCHGLQRAERRHQKVVNCVATLVMLQLLTGKIEDGLEKSLHAVANAAVSTWCSHKGSGNGDFSMLLTFVSTMIGLLKLRRLFLGGSKQKRKGATICRTMDSAHRWFFPMLRPDAGEDEAKLAADFVLMQMKAVYGHADFDSSQAIYDLSISKARYAGRTALSHKTRSSMGGLAIRWEQHQREIWKESKNAKKEQKIKVPNFA